MCIGVGQVIQGIATAAKYASKSKFLAGIKSALPFIQGTAAVAGGYSTYKTGQVRASIERRNAKVAEIKADDARERGRLARVQKQLETADVLSRAKVAYAAQGADLGSGSPLDVLQNIAFQGEIDAQIIRNNYEREAQAYEVQGQNSRAQAKIYSNEAKFGLAGSLLEGGAKFGAGAFELNNLFKKRRSQGGVG